MTKVEEIIKNLKDKAKRIQAEVLTNAFYYVEDEIKHAVSEGYQIQYMSAFAGYLESVDTDNKKSKILPVTCKEKKINLHEWSIEKEFECYNKETSIMCIYAIIPVYCSSSNKICEIYFDIVDTSKAKEVDFMEDKELVPERPIEGGSQRGSNPPLDYYL